ncbi:hypothetical protein CO051_02655 [Candidatus Roizmanbacteria bacterium CG_4_9_14_0_2_um_filter_39_13]|uniref:Uncharacterized protein n=2 Tax=Candidatus Roizmaniibacteriota TaxID=1752723 RepID=A0A2M8F0A9_9BACT|nr:MAG: hypothetical protein CO051_02655 [Candidatus Roizmanbacteria bacterium CG_4_9_14_0_2_um_filter_39_13]PJE62217.1 MAG: hypothetical protein COU87_00535 [Candidatus Roizmanbacteria bacterium CG10_big_fil_rev_8_21_14_0_10_39_12]
MRNIFPHEKTPGSLTYDIIFLHMNNLLPSTQDLVKTMKKGHDMVIMSYETLTSLLATMEEEMDEGSKKARSEAEKDIKMKNIKSFDEILSTS